MKSLRLGKERHSLLAQSHLPSAALDKDPLLTVNLHDIINYVNRPHAVSDIKAKAQDIHATIDNQ